MQFKVPQFIDVEDKLFGNFTFKQFIYLAGGAGMVFVSYRLLPIYLAIPLILFFAALSLLLTFYPINNKPFAYYLQASVLYALKSKLYIWKQRLSKPGDNKKEVVAPTQTSIVPTLSPSKLKDLSWSLDVLDKGKQQ